MKWCLKWTCLSLVWWTAIYFLPSSTHTPHTTHTVLGGPSQAGLHDSQKVNTTSPAMNAHKFWKSFPQTFSSDITFLSEPGWEALSCCFLAWKTHHIREQHLTPMRNRVSLLWEQAEHCFFSLIVAVVWKLACLSASPRIITHTCKTFLGTLGQYFPTSHTKSVWGSH